MALYSRSDGVVDWRSCLAEDAELIEVDASHCGMSLNPQAYRAVAGALSQFGDGVTLPRSGETPALAA